MVLSYRGHRHWRDMSEYVVHFTGSNNNDSALDNLAGILADGEIWASGPFGSARTLNMLGSSQRSACFSEIPLDLLDRLVDRRSPYGVGFHQRTLLEKGGARVWYLDEESDLAGVLRQWVTDQIGNWDSPLWRFTSFIDRPYGVGNTGYRFEWEREWRVPGGLGFDFDQVAFVFAPDEDHGYLVDYMTQYIGRAKDDCPPLVDPEWSRWRLGRSFSGLGS